MYRPAAAQRKCRQTGLINLEQGKVSLLVHTDEPCLHDSLFAHGQNLVGKVHRRHGQSHVDALRPLDHVSVGDNVAVRVHDHS